MRVLGIVGWSGSGKTTLIEAVLPVLRGKGLRVSTIKHAHHGFDLDQPGKDSFRHRAAGAHEVLVATSRRWALMHELEGPEPGLPELLEKLEPVDLVVVEGFKSYPAAKLEVHRPNLGKPPIWPDATDVRAVASDEALPGCDRVTLPLQQPEIVADWIMKTITAS